jgi:DNA-binding winged helix-turn-helix (wHTH) protein/tetratricopeptide (TPR) repeat protein
MNDRPPVYSFGDFILETRERRLTYEGREIHLRPKTYDTLLFLVEQSNHLVKKNDLLDSIWPDVEVTENALTRCIKEVREALNDNVDNPRFIKTITRVGYKFISPVEKKTWAVQEEEIEEEVRAVRFVETIETEDQNNVLFPDGAAPIVSIKLTNQPDLHPLPPVPLTGWQSFVRFITRPRDLAILTTLLIVIAGSIWFFIWRQSQKMKFAQRDWVLIVDFENFTGEKVFDAALRTAIERELTRSSFINVVPAGRLQDTLKLMKQPPDIRLTESVGREICLRDGEIRTMLAGSIQQIGGIYQIAVRIIKPANGVTVTNETAECSMRQDVLPALRRLAISIRKRLGEPGEAIATTDQQMEKVTTPSLEALEYYSKGLQFKERPDFEPALLNFNQALERDPNFAMCYWARGMTSLFINKPAQADFNHAAKLVEGVTLREKLLIQTAQAFYCQGNLAKAIELNELLTQQYPDDYNAQQFLSFLYLTAYDLPKFEITLQNLKRLRPNSAIVYGFSSFYYFWFKTDFERSYQESLKTLELDPDFPLMVTRITKPLSDWKRGDYQKAKEEMDTVFSDKLNKMKIFFGLATRPIMARYYAFMGDYSHAWELLETTYQLPPQLENIDIAKRYQSERAYVAQGQGDLAKFRQLLNAEANEKVGIWRIEALGWLAIDTARRGNLQGARKLQEELMKENRPLPVSLWTPPIPQVMENAKQAFSAQLEGEIAFRQGNLDLALSHFQEVIRLVPPRTSGLDNVPQPRLFLAANLSMARIFEKKEEWDSAVRSYQAILQNKAILIFTHDASSIYFDALKSISPALEKAGRPSEAANYRREFRHLRSSSVSSLGH